MSNKLNITRFEQKVVSSKQPFSYFKKTGLVMALGLTLGVSTVHAQIQFSDVSAAAGIVKQTESYGASWGDLNGDGYPDLFTNNHRTKCSLWLNKGNGTFIDTASKVKTWVWHQHADTHGGSWVDFDNDGDQDLYVSTGTLNPVQFLVNENGVLVDRTDQYGIADIGVGGRLAVWFDYNGDLLPDFVMTQFGGAAKVYTQVPSAPFADSTTTVKMLCKRFHYGQLYDVNGDGHLDFVCADDAVFPQKIYNTLPLPWQKLFDAESPNSAFPTVTQVVDSTIGDFNNDGRMDMFVLGGAQLHPSSAAQGGSNYIESQLSGGKKGFNFVTAGTLSFELDWKRVDEAAGYGYSRIQIGSTAWHPSSLTFTLDPSDPTVSGMPPASDPSDLPLIKIGYDKSTKRWTVIHETGGNSSAAYFQVSSTAPVSNLKSTGLWASDKAVRPTLLMNYSGGYSDGTVAAGLASPVQCVSATAGDFDNDMDLDLYLACRAGASNLQNVLYENQGNGTFKAVPNAGGAGGPVGTAIGGSGAGTADSAVTADYDVDGFLDLFVTNGLNLVPKYYGGPYDLFHNQGNANHWIEIDLVGTLTERDAVGAQVKATANGVTQLRVKNGGYHRWSQDYTRTHFGLAGATTVDIRVEWPSGSVETFEDVGVDKLYRITEKTGIATMTPGIVPASP